MRSALRRLAITSALAVVATGITAPLVAAPANAVAGPVEKTFFLKDTGVLDGQYGLYSRSTPTGTVSVVEAESDDTDVSDLAVSADGSRVIYIRDNYATGKNQVVVRDAGSPFVRVLESVVLDFEAPAFNILPSLSPDGTQAVWTRVTLGASAGSTLSLRKANVASGGSVVLAADLGLGAFFDPTNVLAIDAQGAAVALPWAGGTRSAVPTYPSEAYDLALAPNGKIAYTVDGPTTSSVNVAPLAVNAGVPVFGSPTTIASTDINFAPAFSYDGATLYFVKDTGTGGDIWSGPADGSFPPAAVEATAADDYDVVITTLDAIAPGEVTKLPGLLNGTSAKVTWTAPADADLAGFLVSRAGKVGETFVPAPSTTFTDTGLALGTTYTYTIKAVDRSGNASAGVADYQLTAIKAGAFFGNPTSAYSTKTSFPVRFALGAQPSTVFDVWYLPYGGTWKQWVTGQTGNERVFGSAASTGVTATSAVAGGTYTFKVVATDAFGNASAATASNKAVVPWDQTKATLVGGSNVLSGGAYLGSFRRLSSPSSYARVSLVGNQLQVVGWKCSTCGKLAIYDGATKIATVDTYASSTLRRVVLFSKTYASSSTHTYTIRPLGTPGRPYVSLDGFAMRR